MNRPTVLLADDHEVVIEGLRRILDPEFDIVGTVPDGRALVAAAARLNPDVIVADISMPLLNGVEAARQIKSAQKRIHIIFLTMHPDVTYITEALEAGSSGYVLKSSAGSELVTAIREALDGRCYVTPSIALPLEGALRDGLAGSQRKPGVLTARQREVLQLVAEGRPVKEIAGILHLSSRTVEFHKYGIMRQLGLRTTAELTHYAIKHGILST